jgi:hypothetical protein
MNNQDFHPKCQHCLPLTPESFLSPEEQNELKINLCHMEAHFEQRDRDYKEQFQEQIAFQELQRKKKQEKLLKKREKEGILFQQNKTPTPRRERKLTVTRLTDNLLREALVNNVAYSEGTRDKIVNEVLTQFPGSEERKIMALFYSRRAILRNEALNRVANEIIE